MLCYLKGAILLPEQKFSVLLQTVSGRACGNVFSPQRLKYPKIYAEGLLLQPSADHQKMLQLLIPCQEITQPPKGSWRSYINCVQKETLFPLCIPPLEAMQLAGLYGPEMRVSTTWTAKPRSSSQL